LTGIKVRQAEPLIRLIVKAHSPPYIKHVSARARLTSLPLEEFHE